jgi:SAM-dependent methyltransferase
MHEASLMQCGGFIKGTLLDVGCGHRPYEKTYFKTAAKYVGIDYLSDRSKPDVIASGLHLPFLDESFDSVVSTEVLEHVPDPLRALREMRRVLKTGSFQILSAPMYWPRHEVPYDFFRYPYDGFLYLIQSSGLTLRKLFNRGHAYAFLGQVLQHLSPTILQPRPIVWLLNSFFLWCDVHRRNDQITLGWTAVCQKGGPSSTAGD